MCLPEHLLNFVHGPVDKICRQELKLNPANFQIQVQGPSLVHAHSHFVDFHIGTIRQRDLCPLGNVEQSDPQSGVFCQRFPADLFSQFTQQVLLEELVEIISSQ